jgi:hypothetical protein
VDGCAAVAREVGTAAQIAAACHELFTAPESADLVDGTVTLPIALHHDRLDEAGRAELRELLERARRRRGRRGAAPAAGRERGAAPSAP